MASNFTSACCTSRLAGGNAQEQTHSETSSNYLCTNDGLETGRLPSRGCGDSSAERKFPSDKVYRRNDRAGSSGSSPSACSAWRSSSSTPVLDVRAVVTVPRSYTSRHRTRTARSCVGRTSSRCCRCCRPASDPARYSAARCWRTGCFWLWGHLSRDCLFESNQSARHHSYGPTHPEKTSL
jgi:hypothetical protein